MGTPAHRRQTRDKKLQKLNATKRRIDCSIKERLLAGEIPLNFALIH